MEVSIFCPHAQVVVAIWVLADSGSVIDRDRERAETLETVADVAARDLHVRGVRAGESWREPDVRNS